MKQNRKSEKMPIITLSKEELKARAELIFPVERFSIECIEILFRQTNRSRPNSHWELEEKLEREGRLFDKEGNQVEIDLSEIAFPKEIRSCYDVLVPDNKGDLYYLRSLDNLRPVKPAKDLEQEPYKTLEVFSSKHYRDQPFWTNYWDIISQLPMADVFKSKAFEVLKDKVTAKRRTWVIPVKLYQFINKQ